MARTKAPPIPWGRFRNARGLVTRTAIRRLVDAIAERFQPERIILFGSYAYGAPTPYSDVDVLVVMPCRNEIDQSIRIGNAIDAPFSVDVIVRKPRTLAWRLAEGDWFLREVVGRGKVRYEQADEGVGGEGQRGLPRRPATAKGEATPS
jgi:uncharacterized protein